MRSLHVVTNTARRGAETFAVQLSEQLEQTGQHEAEVVALTSAPGKTFDLEVIGEHRRSPRLLRALRKRTAEVDVVVGHGSSTLEACALSLRGTAVPFVFRSIGDPGYWVRGRIRRRAISWLMRRVDRHVVLWEGARQELARLHGVDPATIAVVANGVDARRFRPASPEDHLAARRRYSIDDDRSVITVVGALSSEKNPAAIIEVARALPETTILVAGDGPARQRLASEAQQLRNLRLIGAVVDPAVVYAAANALLLPSLTEGMPAVVIEAAMVGTPSIATPVGAVPEMLANGRGVLTPSTDPVAIAQTCRSVLHELPQIRTEDWRRYDMHRIAEEWAVVLRDAVASTGGR